MSGYKIWLTFFCLILLVGTVTGQSRNELERRKRQYQQEIREAQKILNETKNQKVASVGQLNAINNQIKNQQTLVNALKSEIDYLQEEISEIDQIIGAMEKDLDALRTEYANMLYAAQKVQSSNSLLVYLFSSNSFNQFFLRLKYMDYYAEARQNQVKQINSVKDALGTQRESVSAKQDEKNALLSEEIKQGEQLKSYKNKQRKIVQDLSEKETDIKADLAAAKRAARQLDQLIANLVKNEIRNSSKGKSSSKMTLTPQAKQLSSNFENNRAKLPWPVASGFISKKFGKQPHPALKGVFIENNGIDIQTQKDQQVRAVFAGKVTKIAKAPPPYYNTIIVQHGEYFTIYAKLKTINVKSGDEIAINQVIGSVYTGKDAISEVHFEIWKNTKRLNPQSWLARK